MRQFFCIWATGALLVGALPAANVQELSESGVVTRVVDGDTIVIEGLGKVRLIGIDTPETVDPRQPVQYFGREASGYTSRNLLRRRVRLEYDWQRKDRYGRTLAYVYLTDGTLFNGKIIQDGYAFAYTKYPFRYMDDFVRYQQEARAAGRGLWGEKQTSEKREDRRQAIRQEPVVEILSGPGSARPESMVTVWAQASPATPCTIEVSYRKGPIRARGLEPKITDDVGRVFWEWTIAPPADPGDWPVRISCNGHSPATVTVTLQGEESEYRVLGKTGRPDAAAQRQPVTRTCCKVCTTGKPCGNTCIARNKTCHKGPGCAC